MPRKKEYTASFKIKVVLEAIKGDKTIAQLSSEYEVYPARIHEWRKQFQGNCEKIFGDPKDSHLAKQIVEKDHKIEILQKKVGELIIDNDFYKKKLRC